MGWRRPRCALSETVDVGCPGALGITNLTPCLVQRLGIQAAEVTHPLVGDALAGSASTWTNVPRSLRIRSMPPPADCFGSLEPKSL